MKSAAQAKPIFIFSLPRSGSTLAQRILGSNPKIATAAEPWLLLPVMYALKDHGAVAEYSHTTARTAVREFIDGAGGGGDAYYEAVRIFGTHLYSSAADGAEFFLDKTPRYHLIIDEVLRAFPDAKCLLMWRNPLAVAASMLSTWGGGRWNLFRFKVDLYKGVDNLCRAAEQYPERFLEIRYEDAVAHPDVVWPKVFEYFGVSYDPSALASFRDVNLRGSMGDPTGVKKFSAISVDSTELWTSAFSGPLRARWARNYLLWIGRKRLRRMGYDYDELLQGVNSKSNWVRGRLFSDAARMAFGAIHAGAGFSLLKRQFTESRQGRTSFPFN